MAGGGKKDKNDEKMGSKIQRFFKSKKNEAKFKLGMTGPGYRLGDSSSSSTQSSSRSGTPPAPAKRLETSQEARQAGAAALARLEKKGSDNSAFGTSLAAIRAEARKQLEAEQAAAAGPSKEESPPPPPKQDPERLIISGVYFACPEISPEILPKKEWDVKIREFLYELMEQDQARAAVLMIVSLTKNQEKVSQCIATLKRMFDNLIKEPDNEKFRRIKISSRAYQEKLSDVEGALELLLAVGFEEQQIANDKGEMEKFLVLPAEKFGEEEREELKELCKDIDDAMPITLKLDRGLQVLQPAQASRRTELPPEVFRLSTQELKRLQQAKTEAIERSQILRTKAMRDKEEAREMRNYKYAVIRVRFPDNTLLQGTFNVYEKLSEVLSFIREQLHRWEGDEKRPFVLTTPTGEKLSEGVQEETLSLLELKLVPTAILNFAWSKPLPAGTRESFLKSDVLALLTPL